MKDRYETQIVELKLEIETLEKIRETDKKSISKMQSIIKYNNEELAKTRVRIIIQIV